MKRARRNKIVFGIVAALVLGYLFTGMIQRGWFSALHLKSSNFLYYDTENRTSDDIVIVAIDNKSFEIKNATELGTLKFDKADFARVIENLEEEGARVIGLDVILSEISTEEDIAVLRTTLEKYNNVILAAEPKAANTFGLKPLRDFIEPHPENLGGILFEPDKDNIVRRQSILFEDPEVPNSFALKIVKKYLNLRDTDTQQTEEGLSLMSVPVRVGVKKFSPITIPIQGNEKILINFFGRPGSYKAISFADVYNAEFIERRSKEELDLKGKIVLIGEFGTGLHDEQFVPNSFGFIMSGVEIHANAIQTILSSSFLKAQTVNNTILLTFLTLIFGLILFLTLNIIPSIIVFIVSVIAYMVSTWIVFAYGTILNTIYPYLALTATLVAAYIYRYFTEARAVLKTTDAFGHYVSENVVKQILENPDQLKLGGVQKTLTVFFTDLESFTTISETMSPGDLVKQLNEYLDRMSEVILKYDGTIDKFVGDAIIAFWGAPIEQPKHPEYACMAALEYIEALEKLNAEWKERKMEPFKVRIGIHTGKMIVGNVGSKKRFDYTVIGDAVNLGSRLEGKNKELGTSILISEDTYKAVKGKFKTREIGLVTIKGKKKAVRVYELVGLMKDTQTK